MDQQLRQLRREMASGNNSEAARRYWQARIRAGERVLLGLSTSFCIQSILNNHVDPDEIIMIIGSTTGFVENGKPGENYETIVDRYMESYWYKHARQQVEKAICSIISRMSEQSHGLPGTWVDASQLHYWGWVPQGSHLGIVGDYINVETNEVVYSASDLISSAEEAISTEEEFRRPKTSRCYRYEVEEIEEAAAPLNLKYGFVKPD